MEGQPTQSNSLRHLAIAAIGLVLVFVAIQESAMVSSIKTQMSSTASSRVSSSSLGKSLPFPNKMIVMKQATSAAPPLLYCHDKEPNKCRRSYQYIAVGQVKCGTQTLKKAAEAHPKIRTHTKFAESYFFLRNNHAAPSNFDITLNSNYLGFLANLVGDYRKFVDKDEDPNDGYVYGEHSPGYLWGLDYDCSGTNDKLATTKTLKCRGTAFTPNVTNVIDRMLRVIPRETLMIATIRDPTKRAYSHFSHFGPLCPDEWYGKVDRVKCFHDMVMAEMMQIKNCFESVGTLHPACIMLPFDHESKGTRLVGLGLYTIFFQLWLQHFPNFCILDVSSHGSDNLVGVARDLELCLGLQPERNLTIDYEPESQTRRAAPMWDITRDILDGFYAPYNRLLCDMAPHTCDWPWVREALEREH